MSYTILGLREKNTKQGGVHECVIENGEGEFYGMIQHIYEFCYTTLDYREKKLCYFIGLISRIEVQKSTISLTLWTY